MRSACALCSAALQSPEQWERGLCDRCWSGRPGHPVRKRTGILVTAVLVVTALFLVAQQVARLERELDAAREALTAARETQAIQDAAVQSADRALNQLGPPGAALVDLQPALRAAAKGDRP